MVEMLVPSAATIQYATNSPVTKLYEKRMGPSDIDLSRRSPTYSTASLQTSMNIMHLQFIFLKTRLFSMVLRKYKKHALFVFNIHCVGP
jgi:hypothetical protein